MMCSFVIELLSTENVDRKEKSFVLLLNGLEMLGNPFSSHCNKVCDLNYLRLSEWEAKCCSFAAQTPCLVSPSVDICIVNIKIKAVMNKNIFFTRYFDLFS